MASAVLTFLRVFQNALLFAGQLFSLLQPSSTHTSLLLRENSFFLSKTHRKIKKPSKKTRKTPLKKPQLSYLHPLPLCGVWNIFLQPPLSSFKVGSPRYPSTLEFASVCTGYAPAQYWTLIIDQFASNGAIISVLCCVDTRADWSPFTFAPRLSFILISWFPIKGDCMLCGVTPCN